MIHQYELDPIDLMPELPNKARFTPKEAAGYLGVHVQTIYRWVNDGKMESVQIGVKLKRIPRHSILSMIGIPD